MNRNDLCAGYDAVADEYVRRIYRELEHKPFDRGLPDGFAAGIRSGGLVADIGCGPGQVGRRRKRKALCSSRPSVTLR